LSSALLAGYIALAVSNFFGFSTVMVALLFFLMPAFLFLEENESAAAETVYSPQRGPAISSRSTSSDLELELDTGLIGQAAALFASLIAVWLVFRAWDNDRLLAAAKRQSALGQQTDAYQMYRSLTTRAPNEALYWDEDALFLAGLASAAAPTDATLAAQLANQAVAATDRAVSLNPVHLSYWKSRAKVFLYLAQFSPEFYDLSLEAMQQAARLAPTDPKIWFNQALLFDNLGRTEEARAAFEKAIAFKPNYLQAIQEYEKFNQRIASQSAQSP
jgi:tetratricopeptide (TPR) repeat protein